MRRETSFLARGRLAPPVDDGNDWMLVDVGILVDMQSISS